MNFPSRPACQPCCPKGSCSKGHTLIELLTAVAILALILMLMFQVVDGIFKATRNQNRSMESVAIGRRALDVMTDDLQNASFNGNATLLAPASPGTNIFSLLVNRRGTNSSASPRFLAVTYSLNGSNQLFRSYGSVGYGETNLLAATLSNPVAGSIPLSRGVLGLQARAITDSASYALSGETASRSNWAVSGSYNGCPVPSGYNALLTDSSAFTRGLTNCTQAIEVWIAAVDDQDYENLKKLGKLPLLVASLNNQTNPAAWQAQVDLLSIPADCRSSLRIQKKTIPLP